MEIVERGQIWMTHEDAMRIMNGETFGFMIRILIKIDGLISPRLCPLTIKERKSDSVSGIVTIGNEQMHMTLVPAVLVPSAIVNYQLSEIEYECDDRDLGKD
jgi:hypothetical protein